FLVAQVGFWAIRTIAIKVYPDPLRLQIGSLRHHLDQGETELDDGIFGGLRVHSSDHVHYSHAWLNRDIVIFPISLSP
ncbi:hypothetical protein CORC01_07254, partial [Colletotrichum orchidophilum]